MPLDHLASWKLLFGLRSLPFYFVSMAYRSCNAHQPSNPINMKTYLAPILLLHLLLSSGFTAKAIPPTAHDVTMQPIVQSSNLLPLSASAVNTDIVMFTIETVPAESAGMLYLMMNGSPMPVTAGMMLSADLAGNLIFKPGLSFTGLVAFTFSATDGNMEVSNTANYNIPVVAHPSVILPVNLLAFNGRLENQIAYLNWQTTHEQEGCYYELQRSFDGKDFTTIATVSGRGRAGIQEYAAKDDLYFFSAQVIYYRLKMVEVNGQGKYSGQVVINKVSKSGGPKAWPVPFLGQMQVSFQGVQHENIQLQLVAMNGAIVKQFRTTARQGINTFQMNQLENLPAGQYTLLIYATNGVARLSVTK